MINVGLANPVISQFLSVMTILGSLSASATVCRELFLFGDEKRAINASCSLILINFLTLLLKTIVMRPRPYMVIPATFIISTESGWSFPSGHSGRVFSLLPSTGKAGKTLALFSARKLDSVQQNLSRSPLLIGRSSWSSHRPHCWVDNAQQQWPALFLI
jgi:undecaprenyl-diphosphatase